MEERQRKAVAGWIRENYDTSFLTDIIRIIYNFYRLGLDSNILKDSGLKQSFLNLLFDQLMKQKENKDIKTMDTQLLFRASEHEYDRDEFIELCDNKGPTITIIHNEYDHIFGGYTSKSWIDTTSAKQYNDSNAFLFMIKPNIKIVLFDNVNSDKTGIWIHQSYGPIFGGGGDIIIKDKCNIDRKSMCYSKSFDFKEKEMAGTDGYFLVDEYEVFAVHLMS